MVGKMGGFGLFGVVFKGRLTTLVGKVTVEKEWLAKKLKSLGLSNCKQLVEFKLSSPHMPCSLLSVNQQCQLLGVNRSGLYYKL
ncbi:hypothetical protein BSPWISOXPB_5014 [uncultured Gammaproteobacteria bacterium]|nr:hypothetical protein BSPWISOXPB_5014 [uncultured Gammaproteobacteria bacterium]